MKEGISVHNIKFRKIDALQNIEVFVFRNEIVCIKGYCTVNVFIVVFILQNKVPIEIDFLIGDIFEIAQHFHKILSNGRAVFFC